MYLLILVFDSHIRSLGLFISALCIIPICGNAANVNSTQTHTNISYLIRPCCRIPTCVPTYLEPCPFPAPLRISSSKCVVGYRVRVWSGLLPNICCLPGAAPKGLAQDYRVPINRNRICWSSFRPATPLPHEKPLRGWFVWLRRGGKLVTSVRKLITPNGLEGHQIVGVNLLALWWSRG